MPHLVGRYETQNASKYLQQLCKHFGHKIDVTYDAQQGSCTFVFGTAIMSADPQKLLIKFDLNYPEAIETAKNVIDRHLEKFAFREHFQSMDWTSG
ncbi:MAG: DUF2218 domain-containing protein [Cognatishimia sp.]|nr:DUF2218 domain-containing protein [Cognatishimia sp.]